ncbi:hypothetical protein TBLA_0C02130 [Henningerozyma blattae CBS 6284]|uniref:Protein LOT5 n=1 Tax=Henningerozyma blattae (strain ATCC 34711 / CBS 6284 / DSM 70876 / NBRC 10599 / NRRL Y-10934 / UCD 77-7) TaxID=1071380 RepID=I2H0X3_HENB6|nr:hypothetical protein TBLA_0C02130 [Tetrapisispora blattae CBS 6284]CCH60025.1 hypothetical protein TBLA_0C02130 [Tetrapisispora blattae CBS 6284]
MSSQLEFTQITNIIPTVENVIPWKVFQSTHPRHLDYSSTILSSNLPILLAGSRDLLLTCLNITTSPCEVQLFILHSHLIIWLTHLSIGLQIPITNIIYHGLTRNNTTPEGNRYELLLTLENDPVLTQFFPLDTNTNESLNTIDLKFQSKYSMYERVYNDVNYIENLFTFKNFGINKGDDLIHNLNDSLTKCLEFNFNSRQTTDSDDEFDSAASSTTLPTTMGETLKNFRFLNNMGTADDLEYHTSNSNDAMMSFPMQMDNHSTAGMMIEFPHDNEIAMKRSR